MKLNKIQNLLKNQKKDMILLFLVMFFLSILELLSIGAIIPFLVIATGIEESNNLYFLLHQLIDLLGTRLDITIPK